MGLREFILPKRGPGESLASSPTLRRGGSAMVLSRLGMADADGVASALVAGGTDT